MPKRSASGPSGRILKVSAEQTVLVTSQAPQRPDHRNFVSLNDIIGGEVTRLATGQLFRLTNSTMTARTPKTAEKTKIPTA
jgi:hypothetical protein